MTSACVLLGTPIEMRLEFASAKKIGEAFLYAKSLGMAQSFKLECLPSRTTCDHCQVANI